MSGLFVISTRLYVTVKGERTLAKVGSKLSQIQVKEHKANGHTEVGKLFETFIWFKERKQIVFIRYLCILNEYANVLLATFK